MTTTDLTGKESKESSVHIRCEGIRTTGEYCDREVTLAFPRTGQPGDGKLEGRRLSKPQRIAKARRVAAKDGWTNPKGFDPCPRIHGFMPTVKAAVQEER